jgi:5-methylcytosine-specific restriction endonuclease McrA
MPLQPLSRCPDCNKLKRGPGKCVDCKKRHYSEVKSVYATKRWRELRDQVLSTQIRCSWCGQFGTPNDHIDHKIPVDVRPDLAYDPDNLQRLHPWCHSIKTRGER